MCKCYNCGIKLSVEIKTKEHIPAQNLYGGYDVEYKKNRIVVPACYNCNQRYSKIDQEIRDVIGILNDDNELQKEITRKAVKSIMRNRNWVKRVSVNGMKFIENISVSFRYEKLRELHIKNFKGVFYYEYKVPLPREFDVEIIAEGDEFDHKLMVIKNDFEKFLDIKKWKESGHRDIFKYRIVLLDLNTPSSNCDFSETDNIGNCNLIICELAYHNTIHPIICAKNGI